METDTSTWVYEVKPPFPWRNIPGMVVVIGVGVYIMSTITMDSDLGYLLPMGIAIVPIVVLMGIAVMYHYFHSRLYVEMDAAEIRIKSPKIKATIRWADVTNWAVDPKLRGFVIACGDERTRVMTPSGESDDRMEIIADAISTRMAMFRGDEKRSLGPIEGGRAYVDAREARNFGFED
jgi:hypothetical protein